MSWDACLGRYWWNYTHNTSTMIYRVLLVSPPPGGPLRDEERWWSRLNGMAGEDGAAYLDHIVCGLLEAPGFFRSMNPENGWGDFDSLLATLVEMRDAGRANPELVWEASG